MWIELLPFAPWAIPSFPVAPADAVTVSIFVADQNGRTHFKGPVGGGGLGPGNNSVWFTLLNRTRATQFSGILPTAPETLNGTSSTGYTGTTAEFIVERPYNNATESSDPLAYFGATTMENCVYGVSDFFDPTPLGPNGSLPLGSELTYLNMVNPSTKDLLASCFSILSKSGQWQPWWMWNNDL
jgi:hypothetical protein